MAFESTKILELGSCAFRQWRADSHCKYIHGYRLVAKFWFKCHNLDEKNWVVDFGGLKRLKDILEKQFDHTLCISADDPELSRFVELHKAGVVDLRILQNGVGIEKFAQWCYERSNLYIRAATNERCWVSKVEVWEHEKNSALFLGDETTQQQSSSNNNQKNSFKEIELKKEEPALKNDTLPSVEEHLLEKMESQRQKRLAAWGQNPTGSM